MKKSEFKDLTLATKELCFIFNNILYKQIDRIAMGSPIGPSVANTFLAYHEENWWDSCSLECRSWYDRQYVDHIFVLSKSSNHF